MNPIGLPAFLLALAAALCSSVLVFVGIGRAARSGGLPVSYRRLLRRPAAPWLPLGLVLLGLVSVDVAVFLIVPGIAAETR